MINKNKIKIQCVMFAFVYVITVKLPVNLMSYGTTAFTLFLTVYDASYYECMWRFENNRKLLTIYEKFACFEKN